MLGLVMMMMMVWWADPPPPLPPATPPPPSAETVCRVEVTGIPASVRGEHELVWAGGRAEIDDVVDIRFRGRETGVLIRGPRYRGAAHLSPSRCSSGVRIDARPRPARVDFRCAPKGLVVRCERCPGGAAGRWVSADHFPTLPMDSYIREVNLEFKAAGYRGSSRRVILYPGLNLVDVTLEKLR